MASGAHLISNRLNAAQVLAAAQTELLDLLGDPAVKKVRAASRGSHIPRSTLHSNLQVIVWDPDLIQPMTLVAEPNFIRKAGVTKMVRLPVQGLTERYEDASEFIFLTRPTLSMVDMVAEAIRLITNNDRGSLVTSLPLSLRTSRRKSEKRFTVAFTPHKVEYCIMKLKVSAKRKATPILADL